MCIRDRGATASRDYFPAITEAHYRKLPVLAITGAREVDTYGHLNPQTINPVSYTHLDVYKRQLHCIRIMIHINKCTVWQIECIHALQIDG